MKRIVLFVEGEGEAEAVPKLVKRLLSEQSSWDVVRLDPHPFRVREINHILKDACKEWKNKLCACLKRPSVGGVLLVLDGDAEKTSQGPFCAANIAKYLASEATTVGGGTIFSVAVVFARQEYESWLIAGIDSLAGQSLPDGRVIAPRGETAPHGDLEESPRNAKGWLSSVIEGGYKPTRDQSALTDLLDLDAVRRCRIRSFTRLESALTELVLAIRNEEHIVSPR